METQQFLLKRVKPINHRSLPKIETTLPSIVDSQSPDLSIIQQRFKSQNQSINQLSIISDLKHGGSFAAVNSSMASQRNNSTKFHTVQNTIYQIHKAALTKYIMGHSLDPRLQQMNLLKASQMTDDEIQTLQKAFFDDKAKLDIDLQEKVEKVLNHFKVKNKNNRERYIKYFNDEETKLADEMDVQQLSIKLRDVLDQKLKCQKLFNGTYLVDPSVEELERQIHKLPSNGNEELRLPIIQKISSKRPKQLTYEQLTNHTVEDIVTSQHTMIKNLRKRFSVNSISQQETRFFECLHKRDYAELSFMLRIDKSLIEAKDEKGQGAAHLSVILGDAKLLQILIGFGLDLNMKNAVNQKFELQVGKTALQLSRVYLNDEITQVLKDPHKIRRK